MTINEPGTYAVKTAIEAAVVELIKEGQRKSVWDFKTQTTQQNNKEGNQIELVQEKTPDKRGETSPASLAQPDRGQANGGN